MAKFATTADRVAIEAEMDWLARLQFTDGMAAE